LSPDFRELVGEEEPTAELARLRHVHDLLAGASPPPRLSRRLAQPPRLRRRFAVPRPTPVLAAAALAAAAAVAVGFGIGYSVDHGSGFSVAATRSMHGIGQLRSASASIQIGRRNAGGNWPLLMTVRGLPRLPKDGWYELYLTDDGEREVSCGTFRTGGPDAIRVGLNAPYGLDEYDGWIVTAHVPGKPERPLLTT
jgi:hypothetical protein